ncbi:hypothetical protein [Paraburkholderia tropica]|uniref:hypothetical protein n=1 Tax=Paraburkholderia tropica TaxID=92647 RepID=UPI003D28E113
MEQQVGMGESHLAQALGLSEVDADALRKRVAVLERFINYVEEQQPSFDLTSSLTFGATQGSKLFRKMDLSIDDGNSTISLLIDAQAILDVKEDYFMYLIFDDIVEQHVTDDEDDDESNLAKQAAETLSQMYEKFITA